MKQKQILTETLGILFWSIFCGLNTAFCQMAGFEDSKPGNVTSFSDSLGDWTVIKGTVNISDKYAKTGKQCLHIAGGEKTTLELELAQAVDKPSALKFWAERWTRNAPFKFRIEAFVDENWQEIFNGDKVIRVGKRFLTHDRCTLGESKTKRIRFIVSSPGGTGVLLDDMSIVELKRQRILEVNETSLAYPCVVGKLCPIGRLNIKTEGSLDSIAVKQIVASIESKSLTENIVGAELWFTSNDQVLNQKQRFSLAMPKSGKLTFDGNCKLVEGDNFFWVAIRFDENADVDQTVGVNFTGYDFLPSDNDEKHDDGKANLRLMLQKQRLAIAVRKAGDDGVNTYRIPGLATTNKGTLIAVYDVRHKNSRDLPGDIDVGMSRSTDGGRNWEPMKIIIDMGNDRSFSYDGVGDPSILVDRNTGTIWVAGLWSHGERAWTGSQPGMNELETGQFILVKSDNDGKTWSKPINITRKIKDPSWSLLLAGPGKGICMSDGTIAFPAQYQDPPDWNDDVADRLPHSTFIYSRDHGETWEIASGAFDDTTESQLVELNDGQIMLNCRYNRENKRVVMITDDLGKTWREHPTSRKDLIEPRACMASLINVSRELGKKDTNWLLFSNPNHPSSRQGITIKASPDGGMTWPKRHQLLLDGGVGRGYSCMTMIDEKTVGILYESSQADLVFQRVPLNDIIAEQ